MAPSSSVALDQWPLPGEARRRRRLLVEAGEAPVPRPSRLCRPDGARSTTGRRRQRRLDTSGASPAKCSFTLWRRSSCSWAEGGRWSGSSSGRSDGRGRARARAGSGRIGQVPLRVRRLADDARVLLRALEGFVSAAPCPDRPHRDGGFRRRSLPNGLRSRDEEARDRHGGPSPCCRVSMRMYLEARSAACRDGGSHGSVNERTRSICGSSR
jgi:hypothetical protein